MPSVAEAQGYGSQLASTLAAGVRQISSEQQVTFTPYVRQVLPIDGFVFWCNASLVSANALSLAGLSSAAPVAINGSLHFATSGEQREDEAIAVKHCVFTALERITALAEIGPNALYIATWTAPSGNYSFKFSFSARNSFYQQSGLHHYVGDAVYPAFETQIIDSIDQFGQRPVVSNSLPIWLAALMQPNPPLPAWPISPEIPTYPAYLVPDNLMPPYAAVYVEPMSTRAYQTMPTLSPTYTHNQLFCERVRITTYGLRNDEALDLQDYLLQYSLLTDAFGVLNIPGFRDDHRTQQELAVLAQKKVIDFEISYYQTRVRELAQQYFKTVIPAVTPSLILTA